MADPERRNVSAVRACLLLLGLLVGLPRAAVQATAHRDMKELYLYGLCGSDTTFPGVPTEQEGGVLLWKDGKVLRWMVTIVGSTTLQWILSLHYGDTEPDLLLKYKERVNLSISNGSFQLLNLTKEDSGVYNLYLMGDVLVRITLTVLEHVSVPRILATVDRLQCKASGNVWNITWMKDGKELIQCSHPAGNCSKLIINRTNADYYGNYTCVVWNPLSRQESSYHLSIEPVSVPRIWLSDESASQLSCKAFGDVWTMTWIKDGKEIKQCSHPLGNCSELMIKVSSSDSARNYTCVVWNPVNEQKSSFLLTQQSIESVCFISFLVAAMMFSLPLSISWTYITTVKKAWQRRWERLSHALAIQIPTLVLWLFFLIFASVSGIIGMATSIPYGNRFLSFAYGVFLISCLLIEFLRYLRGKVEKLKQLCKSFKGVICLIRKSMHVCACLSSWATLIVYFSIDFSACRKAPYFVVAISCAAVVPYVVILVYCIYHCGWKVLKSDSLVGQSLAEEEHELKDVAMKKERETAQDSLVQNGVNLLAPDPVVYS